MRGAELRPDRTQRPERLPSEPTPAEPGAAPREGSAGAADRNQRDALISLQFPPAAAPIKLKRLEPRLESFQGTSSLETAVAGGRSVRGAMADTENGDFQISTRVMAANARNALLPRTSAPAHAGAMDSVRHKWAVRRLRGWGVAGQRRKRTLEVRGFASPPPSVRRFRRRARPDGPSSRTPETRA